MYYLHIIFTAQAVKPRESYKILSNLFRKGDIH